jgi:hypothetical protein
LAVVEKNQSPLQPVNSRRASTPQTAATDGDLTADERRLIVEVLTKANNTRNFLSYTSAPEVKALLKKMQRIGFDRG